MLVIHYKANKTATNNSRQFNTELELQVFINKNIPNYVNAGWGQRDSCRDKLAKQIYNSNAEARLPRYRVTFDKITEPNGKTILS